jgi:hypothetical protein
LEEEGSIKNGNTIEILEVEGKFIYSCITIKLAKNSWG